MLINNFKTIIRLNLIDENSKNQKVCVQEFKVDWSKLKFFAKDNKDI